MENIEVLRAQAVSEIASADTLSGLEQLRVHYLGKKGLLTDLLKKLGELPPAERPRAGQIVNDVKVIIQQAITDRRDQLSALSQAQALQSTAIDVTLPGRGHDVGSVHPITQTRLLAETIFRQMGFETIEGPEIEDEYHNFTALNMPEHHPARAMHDTFYLDVEGLLLRTHTSTVQIRAMKERQPPLRFIAPGRVYRCDSDATHTPMFHQMEGLMIDASISFSNLKSVLIDFLTHFFGKTLSVRFRPSYFPFTEPSAEVDIACVNCEGKGCRVCKQTGWLEVLGCGMVHPRVLQAVAIDSERYMGFAFGMGLDRLTMLRFGINDLRLMFENDIRFLRQF